MGRYRGRTATSKFGFVPKILDHDGNSYFDVVLNNSYVEYGTGCWIDKGSDPEVAYEGQVAVYHNFMGDLEEGSVVVNSCNDYRICYNPNCLITLDIDDLNYADLGE